MLNLIYDPAKVADPEGLAASLGIGSIIEGVPPAFAGLNLGGEGYAVVRETWQGIDVLTGPVSPQQIAALPDPGPDPAVAARKSLRAIRDAIGSDISPVDPAVVQTALGRLDAIIATGSVDPLPANPTNADVVAQVRTLTTAVNLEADAIRDLARIIRAMLRLLS